MRFELGHDEMGDADEPEFHIPKGANGSSPRWAFPVSNPSLSCRPEASWCERAGWQAGT